MSPPVDEETMPSSTNHESPTPFESLPIDEPTRPVTQRASKRSHMESNPPDMADPYTLAPRPKHTKHQAKWANHVRTCSVTKPLPPLQETPASPITISFEEEPPEPDEDIQSPHSPPSIMGEPPEVFPEGYRTPSAKPFSPSDLELPTQTKEQSTVNEEIQILRGKLAEAEVLERHLKAKNVQLKDRVATLREQKKAIKNIATFYYRKGYRWFCEAIKLIK